WYPPVGFYFKVNVVGINGKQEGNFQEVSGLNVKITAEDVKEGGENRFIHRLPTRPRYDNLVLKRGMLLGSSLVAWVQKGIEQFTFLPKTVIINLMDENASPLASWKFINAYPVAMKISEFKAQESTIAFETFELCFDYFMKVN
ncbi:MAG: phage tail protein, partial [Chitinophagaceae bacterium]